MKTTQRFLYILIKLFFTPHDPIGLRKTFEDLGPTFVKLGQLLSSRPDMVPQQYTEEFRKLLDSEKPLPFSIIEKLLQKNIGKPLNETFLTVNPEPISSASIGQVHIATLLSKEKVALKIRRPDIERTISLDMQILDFLAYLFNFIPFFHSIGFKKLLHEFSHTIWDELDFTREAENANRLAENLKDYSYIKLPKIHSTLTTPELLVSEYLHGITINEVLNRMAASKNSDPNEIKTPFKINFEKIVNEAIEIYIFKQILEDGYFHGDPHPANIILLPENRIGFVDFGIMGTIDMSEHRQALILILSIIDNDPQSLVKALTAISEKDLSKKENLEITEAISDELHKIHGSNLHEATIGELAVTIISLGRHFNLHWSRGITACLRAIALVEGIALRLIPNASMVDLIKPYLRKFLAKEAISKFSEEALYKNLLKALEFGETLPNLTDLISEKGIKVQNTGN